MQVIRSLFALWLLVCAGKVCAQARALPEFTHLVEERGPAVVNISTTQAPQRAARGEREVCHRYRLRRRGLTWN